MFMRDRQETRDAIGRMGAACCAYTLGDVDAWLRTRCDCKYGGERVRALTETGNGCPELRSMYAILGVITDAEWLTLVDRAGGIVTSARRAPGQPESTPPPRRAGRGQLSPAPPSRSDDPLDLDPLDP